MLNYCHTLREINFCQNPNSVSANNDQPKGSNPIYATIIRREMNDGKMEGAIYLWADCLISFQVMEYQDEKIILTSKA